MESNASQVKPEYVSSQCGAQKLVIDGYTYVCQRKGDKRTHWRCDHYQKDKCRATAMTEDEKVHIKHDAHNHKPNTSTIAAKRIYAKLKAAILDSNEPVPEVIRRTLAENSAETAMARLPSFETLCNSMRKYRTKMQQIRSEQCSDADSVVLGNDYRAASSILQESCAISVENIDRLAPEIDPNRCDIFPVKGRALDSSINVTDKIDNCDLDFKVFMSPDSRVNNWCALSNEANEERDGCYKKHAENLLLKYSFPPTTIIDRIMEEYRALCNVRNTAELSISRNTITAMFSSSDDFIAADNQSFIACTYAKITQYRQLEIPFLVQFFRKAFNEIGHLDKEYKVSLFKNFAPYFWLAEIAYSTFCRGIKSEKLFISMLRYVDKDCMQIFFELADYNNDKNRNAINAFEKLFTSIISDVLRPMKTMEIMEGEFAMLLALLFSDSDIENETNQDLIAFRDSVLREIEIYYRCHNVECYASRIASLVRMNFRIIARRKQLLKEFTSDNIDNFFEVIKEEKIL